MEKLRVAVIGVGYLGKFHVEKFSKMADVDLVGIVDIDKARAVEIAKRYSLTPYFSHEEISGKVDAVSVVVPTPDHFNISKYFLERDVDVLIEKPMTISLEEADELIDFAESRGLLIQVGHLERFNPAVVALEGIVKKPMFIESHRLSIFQPRGTDVSVVLDLMIHDIDIILNYVRSDVKTIHAAGIPVVSNHVDIANARLEFESGCVANVTASRISTRKERKIRMFQREAYISVDFANHEITIISQNGGKGEGIIPGMDIQQLCFTKKDALEDELSSFVRAVRDRESPEVTGQMGRDALRVALNIMEQIQTSTHRFLQA
jgi:predicted dehydrogenase